MNMNWNLKYIHTKITLLMRQLLLDKLALPSLWPLGLCRQGTTDLSSYDEVYHLYMLQIEPETEEILKYCLAKFEIIFQTDKIMVHL